MTQTINDRRARYSATAAQTNFDGDFKIDSDADVAVFQKVLATGVVTELTLTTHYTVTLDGVAPSTFDVDLVTGAAAGDIITIEGDTSADRDTDFSTGGDYFAATVNNAEDRQYRLMQEIIRDRDRSLIANPVSPATFLTTLPDVVGGGGKFWRLNAAETAMELAALVSTAAVLSDAVALALGTASAGTSPDLARVDHVHPTTGVVTTAGLEALITGTTRTYTKPQRGAVTALTSTAASIAIELNDGNNFKVAALQENSTLANPTSTPVAGQTGRIVVIQDGTGSRTLSYGSQYLWGSGVPGVLSTAANAIDMLAYEVISATEILLTLPVKAAA